MPGVIHIGCAGWRDVLRSIIRGPVLLGLPYYSDNTLEKIGVVLFDRRCAMQCAAYAFWSGEEGQDIAEYAVMLAVILVIVIGTIRLIGGNANNVFSSVASSLQ